MSTYTETEEIVLTEEVLVDEQKIVLFNDDVNTFDFVIESLVDVCGHDFIQAEQCWEVISMRTIMNTRFP